MEILRAHISRLFKCLLILLALGPTSSLYAEPNLARVMSDLEIMVERYDVYPYSLMHAAFSDYAYKDRFLLLPKGLKARISVTAAKTLLFPNGSIILKIFYYHAWDGATCYAPGGRLLAQKFDQRIEPHKTGKTCLLEVRTLTLSGGRWNPSVFISEGEQQRLQLSRVGGFKNVGFYVDGEEPQDFIYSIPSLGECAQCHMGALANGVVFDPIGPSLIQRIDWRNTDMKILSPADRMVIGQQFGGESLKPEDVARSYLDINCGHCHNPSGLAASSGLFLTADINSPLRLGICKPVVASGAAHGGSVYDVVPGEPNRSILLYRMKALETAEKMPEIGRNTIDDQGVQWVSEWIAGLSGACTSS